MVKVVVHRNNTDKHHDLTPDGPITRQHGSRTHTHTTKQALGPVTCRVTSHAKLAEYARLLTQEPLAL